MKALKIIVLAGLCLLLMGCPAILGAIIKNPNPSFLQASRGKGTDIRLDWAAPSFEDKDEDEENPETDPSESVDYYNVFRDGVVIDQTTSEGYTDDSGLPGHEYDYKVNAVMDDGSTTSTSNTDTGWYVPAENLAWDGDGVANHSGTGWFETVVVEGWTYHIAVPSGTDVTVLDHQHPSRHLDEQTSDGTWTWKATRTGRVWMNLNDTDVVAWHD